MSWEISNLIQNGIIILALLAVLFCRIGGKGLPPKERNSYRIFVGVIVAELVLSFINAMLGKIPDSRNELVRIMLTDAIYILGSIILYGITTVVSAGRAWKYKKAILVAPVVIIVLTAIISLFTSSVFMYDDHNAFHSAPLLYVMMAVFVVQLVFAGIFCLVEGKNYKSEYISHETVAEKVSAPSNEMLDQTIETLAAAIDSRGGHSRGHSLRVAKYARNMARLADKSEEECRQVYMAGLLHDIGRLSISEEILNKAGKLTDEEYEIVKKHTINGVKALGKMSGYPYLLDGVLHHHERYDGTGYPDGLSGEDIPEIARILAVADAYDAMTSNRSYRAIMDQIDVKHELWKGSGTQFDQRYAQLMISLLDADMDYNMREKEDENEGVMFDDNGDEIVWKRRMPVKIKADNQVLMETRVATLGEFTLLVNNWSNPSEAVCVDEKGCNLEFKSYSVKDGDYVWFAPSAIIFSSANGQIGGEGYDELGVFMNAGYGWRVGSAISQTTRLIRKKGFEGWDQWIKTNKEGKDYHFSAYRQGAHVYITLDNDMLTVKGELLLPETFDKPVYMAAAGEKCTLEGITLLQEKHE